MTKIPSLRWLPGTRFVSPHGTTPIKLSDITGVLLHFKFVEDFFTGVRDRGSKRVLGWAGEYARYLAKFEDEGLPRSVLKFARQALPG
jgi:hypothetical protein